MLFLFRLIVTLILILHLSTPRLFCLIKSFNLFSLLLSKTVQLCLSSLTLTSLLSSHCCTAFPHRLLFLFLSQKHNANFGNAMTFWINSAVWLLTVYIHSFIILYRYKYCSACSLSSTILNSIVDCIIALLTMSLQIS